MKRLLLLASLSACVDTTGGALVHFHVAVAGPADAQSGQPLTFTTGRFQVALTRAVLHVGAIYLNRSVPTAGAQPTSCFLQGTGQGQGAYVGQVTQKLGDVIGQDVDLLSPAPQYFSTLGEGVADHASTGEVWLMGRDINAPDDQTVILDVAGIATDAGGTDYPFVGKLTIGSNRMIPVSDPAQPGAFPLCKQRIVTVSRQVAGDQAIPIDVNLVDGGTLLVRADPRAMFASVDFSQLPFPPPYQFGDKSDPGPNLSLYTGMRAKVGVYSFEMMK